MTSIQNHPATFTLRCPRRDGIHRARLTVMPDGGQPVRHDMQWHSFEGAFDVFTLTLPSPKAGLYFYSFETNQQYQWLVTRPNTTPCNFIKGGIIYHIFVDRFHRGGNNPPKDNVILREDWGGTPYWRPNAQGIVENRDFFGGDLEGIIKKLPYLHSLGVTCLYLSPIFQAHSNHKYDTGDYHKIDPMFGSEADFTRLCTQAAAYGIKVILDGVFNHTGSDSVYFRDACQNRNSEYYHWYHFDKHPTDYRCWWGIKILPAINQHHTTFLPFIKGEKGVINHWMRAGAAGFRLDVADELSDEMLDAIYAAIKRKNPDGYVLAEVWEDASNKIAYGQRRRYLQGGQCDGVMNYPLRTAIISYIQNQNAEILAAAMAMLVDHYPPEALHSSMTPLATHDTARLLTALCAPPPETISREQQAEYTLSESMFETAITRAKLAIILQYTLPGVPSVYYGEEAGMQGYADPFNRRCYPWDSISQDLLAFYRKMGEARLKNKAFKDGKYKLLKAQNGLFAFARGDNTIIAVNAADIKATIDDIITLGPWEGAVIIDSHRAI
ncbi:MAG: glycoside hydrolase family 13 protein [Clostridia bacterium]|nr:glycoside hydrolase family 13 protein [Clostridia bacterium]